MALAATAIQALRASKKRPGTALLGLVPLFGSTQGPANLHDDAVSQSEAGPSAAALPALNKPCTRHTATGSTWGCRQAQLRVLGYGHGKLLWVRPLQGRG